MIRSMDEFKKKYYPKTYEEERLAKMTPEELGREAARETLQKVSKVLRRPK